MWDAHKVSTKYWLLGLGWWEKWEMAAAGKSYPHWIWWCGCLCDMRDGQRKKVSQWSNWSFFSSEIIYSTGHLRSLTHHLYRSLREPISKMKRERNKTQMTKTLRPRLNGSWRAYSLVKTNLVDSNLCSWTCHVVRLWWQKCHFAYAPGSPKGHWLIPGSDIRAPGSFNRAGAASSSSV